MQATAYDYDKPRRINQSYGSHQKATEAEGARSEDSSGKLLVVLHDQALFFAKELLRQKGREGGREG